MKSLFFQSKQPPPVAKFYSRSNYLYPSTGPSAEGYKGSVDADVVVTNKYHDYRYRQDAHERRELLQLSKQLGRPVMAPLYKKVGKDVSRTDAMELSVGQNWPSLAYDFGVPHSKDPLTGSVLEETEFKINWNEQKKNKFSGILRFAPQFMILGLSIPGLEDVLEKMEQVESDMYNSTLNPYPKPKYGKGAITKSMEEREAAAVMARNSFVFHFNKSMDENEIYLRIRFEGISGPKDLSQNLVFTFPTSNEQRTIWQHVFWGYDYPAGGIPMDTNYGRSQTTNNDSMQRRSGILVDLADQMGAMNFREELPPTYDRAPTLVSGGR